MYSQLAFIVKMTWVFKQKLLVDLKDGLTTSKIPNQLWHVDANQKLSRWYIIIFIADTILYFLSKRCAKLLFFWCVRRDQCMKNVVVAGFMI